MTFEQMQEGCPWAGLAISGKPACMAYGDCSAENCAAWFFVKMNIKKEVEK